LTLAEAPPAPTNDPDGGHILLLAPTAGPGTSDTRSIARAALVVFAALTLGICIDLVVVSRLQHRAAQTRAFADFRKSLALGTAPVGSTGVDGRLLPLGTPVALLEVPSIHLREVVAEGTTSATLMAGPGHLRSTVLPGQVGVSVLFGRASSYGGPFGNIDGLQKGSAITVTTGAGRSRFEVVGIRREGDPQPVPLGAGKARLTLVTASGRPFFPDGVLRVDADLVGDALPASPTAMGAVPAAEQIAAGDTSELWVLVLLLQALILLTGAAVWSWLRWGRQQTWIVFFPVVALVGHFVADRVIRLLPNLL
jgi:LPXTG-site transpeptidase (sortase) family protein